MKKKKLEEGGDCFFFEKAIELEFKLTISIKKQKMKERLLELTQEDFVQKRQEEEQRERERERDKSIICKRQVKQKAMIAQRVEEEEGGA